MFFRVDLYVYGLLYTKQWLAQVIYEYIYHMCSRWKSGSTGPRNRHTFMMPNPLSDGACVEGVVCMGTRL